MAYFREQLRFDVYDEIYVSPHMDDAAYSCGGRILQARARGARVLVLTVFGTGRAAAPADTAQTHFTDYTTRTEEELAVMRRLDADYIWLDYPELLFRKNSLWDVARFFLPFMRLGGRAEDELFALVLGVCGRLLAPGGQLLVPLAVGFHPDHRLLFGVGRALQALGRFQVTFYEDVPYSLKPPLTALQLRLLGVKRRVPPGRAASELNGIWLREYGNIGAYLWLPLTLYLALLVPLLGLLRALGLRREPVPLPSSREIADVIEQKADIMRLYRSQTAYFLTLGDALVEMIKVEGEAREHTWSFPAHPGAERSLSAAQRAAASSSPRA